MTIALKPISEQTIVITGASSGIGLATARVAAKQSARLVLAARDEQALNDLAREIDTGGGQAIYVVADVSQREDVQRIFDAAIERFGGFDTWVNNAGVGLWGRLEEVSDEEHRRLFDTNFWGLVYGSQIALKHLKQQGGALINLGSVASDRAFPIQGMYSASKHAIKGFTDALRVELEADGAPVSVTLIKPTSIGTPFPQHAKNYTDKEPTLPPPVYKPESVAEAILHAASHPERGVYIGSGAKVMSTFSKFAPRAVDWLSEKVAFQAQMRDEPARPRGNSLYEGGPDGNIYGEFPGTTLRKSLYTHASLHPVQTGVVMAAIGIAAAALLRHNHRA